jgi:hypothetical protein
VVKIGESPGNQIPGIRKTRGSVSLGSWSPEDRKNRDRPSGGHVERSRHRGKSRKEHFGISATGRCRGESSELLTHRILKESECWIKGGFEPLILLRRRRTGGSGFRYFGISDTGSTRGQGIVVLGVTEFRNVNSRKRRRSVVGSRGKEPDFGIPDIGISEILRT